MQNEKFRQERLLDEKRKNRMAKRKIKEMEIDQKHMNELTKKELEMQAKKYNQEV